MCSKRFDQGDRGFYMGWMTLAGMTTMRWVHIKCLLIEVVGPELTKQLMVDE
jgi:hypothetical protein